MKITLLGTGSPESHVNRASSGYLIQTHHCKVLLDCGGGVVDRLLQVGLMPGDITHLFFTHLHSDHMMDYARLVHAAWDEGANPLPVYGPAPIAHITDLLFGREGVFATDLTARTEVPASQEVWLARGGTLPRPWPSPKVTEITPGFQFEHEDGWTLSSCAVPHAQPFLDCLAFRVEENGKRFVFSGDAGLCTELEALAKECDVLLHWCYRASGDLRYPSIAALSPDPEDIAQLASRCKAKRLILTHIRKQMDTAASHESMLSDISKHYDGDAEIAADLLSFEL